MVDFARLENGKLELQDSIFSLRTLIEEAIDITYHAGPHQATEVLYEVQPHTYTSHQAHTRQHTRHVWERQLEWESWQHQSYIYIPSLV